MNSLKVYIETLSNKFTTSCDDDYPAERDEYDTGYVEGWEQACHSILTYMNKDSNGMIPAAKYIYEQLKEIRYDKNASGQFSSAKLKDEFTDYALRDIATKLYLGLSGTSNAEGN